MKWPPLGYAADADVLSLGVTEGRGAVGEEQLGVYFNLHM